MGMAEELMNRLEELERREVELIEQNAELGRKLVVANRRIESYQSRNQELNNQLRNALERLSNNAWRQSQ